MLRGPCEISLFLTGLRTDAQIGCGSWNKGTLEPVRRSNKRLHLSGLSRGCLNFRVESSPSPAVAVLSTSSAILEKDVCSLDSKDLGGGGICALRSRFRYPDNIISDLVVLRIITYDLATAKFGQHSHFECVVFVRC